jgi:hypothetical protein
MDEKDKKAVVIDLIKAAAKKPAKPLKKAVSGVAITGNHGDGNGIGNTIIKTERVITRTVAKPQPGIEHITEDQVAKLHALKDEIIKLEALAKRDPATPQRVWAALNRKMGVGAMRMIPASKFKAAEKFMLVWLGQLTDRPAVQKKAPDAVAKRRIAYIQTNMKKLDCENRVRDYMGKHFGVRSLTDLPDAAAMERVYRYVASIKKGSGVP